MKNRSYLFLDDYRPTRVARSVRQRGTTLVEFAFVIITFMTFLFGIIGFGHGLYAYHFVSNEAKEATRWAAVNGSTCNSDTSCNGTAPMNNGPVTEANIQDYVTNHIPPGIDPAKVTTVACGVLNGTLPPVPAPKTAIPGAPPTCSESIPTTCTATPNLPGCTVGVRISYSLTFILPLLPTKTASTDPLDPCSNRPGFCLSSTSKMVIAH
jgi:Flp pilus assembly protein TadG